MRSSSPGYTKFSCVTVDEDLLPFPDAVSQTTLLTALKAPVFSDLRTHVLIVSFSNRLTQQSLSTLVSSDKD